ncbi:MAG TPA: hypothetical protein VGJ53_19410 [Micromonosporaceae bacterium]|jgi:hypothetical protein
MSDHALPIPDPLVSEALDCLQCFTLDNRYAAARLLMTWIRYDEPDPKQVREILSAYPSRALRGAR